MSVTYSYAKFVFMGLLSIALSLPRPIKIGAIFHEDDAVNYVGFVKALEALEKEQIARSFELQPSIKFIKTKTDSFRVLIEACSLIEEGVAAIFGPANPFTTPAVASVTSRFNIPHIEYMFRRIDDAPFPPTTINLYPDSEKIANVLADMLESMSWVQFTVMYETNDGLSRLQKALMKHGPKDFPVTVRQLTPTFDKIKHEMDYRPVLKEVANSTDYNIMLDFEPLNMEIILEQAKEVKLLDDYYNYLITCYHCPEETLVDALDNSNANVTVMHILHDESAVYELETIESALLFDAVLLFNDALEAFKEIYENDQNVNVTIEPKPLSCEADETYGIGSNLTALMRKIATEGRMTGHMTFNDTGGRSFRLTFKEYRGQSAFESGYWQNGELTIIRTEKEREQQSLESIEQKVFRVTTRAGKPYVIEVEDGSNRGVLFPRENKRYEGYAIDLIQALSDVLKFRYTFELVPDGQYGAYDKDKKQWNGLIGRLLSRDADLAVCDLTITKERENAVDFTMPFMNLGISILFAKRESKEPKLFSFLLPFSADVWIYMATAFMGVSLLIFIEARIAPEEWVGGHPCEKEPTELENSFNLKNCLWLTTGTLVQQGSDLIPRASSVRMAASMWSSFAFILISSYTANLAAFLTATKMGVVINNVGELAAQTKIKYGVLKDGSSASFFKGSNISTYQKMWVTMSDAKPTVFVGKNEEGVDRVAKGKRTYAFLMESTGIEYAIERNCNLKQVGSLLDNKGYGIALPPNSPYRTQLNEAVLKLQEKGTLHELKDKWWLRGSKNCTARTPPPSSGALSMANLGGIFVVLMGGTALGVVFAIFEFIWNVRKVAIEEKITPWEAFVAEAKFVFNFMKEKKPVKKSKSSSRSSGEEAAKAASREQSVIDLILQLDKLAKANKKKDRSSSSRRSTI